MQLSLKCSFGWRSAQESGPSCAWCNRGEANHQLKLSVGVFCCVLLPCYIQRFHGTSNKDAAKVTDTDDKLVCAGTQTGCRSFF